MPTDFGVLCNFSFISSNHSTAAMATRTPGTTTRVIILPARRGSTDCDSRNGHRKQFYQLWTDVSPEQPPRWFWCCQYLHPSPRFSVPLSLTSLKKRCLFCSVISFPAEGRVKRWQKYWCSHSAFLHFIQKYFCMRLQAALSWNSSKFVHVIRASCQSRTFCTNPRKRCFRNVYKSVYSMAQCSCLWHAHWEKRLCQKNLFISTAWVNGEMSVTTCGFEARGKSLFTEQ